MRLEGGRGLGMRCAVEVAEAVLPNAEHAVPTACEWSPMFRRDACRGYGRCISRGAGGTGALR